MATLREIKRRISAVKSTQKITRAMQMVAAAKLRRAQENILKMRPYAIELEKVIAEVAMRSKSDIHPLLTSRPEEKKVLLISVTGEAGLSGSFNANAIKAAQTYFEQNHEKKIDLFCIGRKGRDFFRRNDYPVIWDKVMFFNSLKYSDAVQIISRARDLFLESGYDRVLAVYNEFKSAIAHNLVIKQILPLIPADPEPGVFPVDYIYEPDEHTVFDQLIPYYLETEMWRILLESYAAEMGAKMTAMDAATENASELLNTLSINYNRARQAQITRELTEIVGGAEGLRG